MPAQWYLASLLKMQTNKFGEIVLNEADLCDLVLSGRSITAMERVTVDPAVNIEGLIRVLEDPGALVTWAFPADSEQSVADYDALQQRRWHMPEEYQQLDIAEYVLGLCTVAEQIQRVGEELLLYQERGLFDLLRYLKYLVDVMRENQVIWGVGRGSSVASYVLYLLGVHRIDSLFYDLDIREFLR